MADSANEAHASGDDVARRAADLVTEVTEEQEARQAGPSRDVRRFRRSPEAGQPRRRWEARFEAAAHAGAGVAGRSVRATARGARAARRGVRAAGHGVGAGTGWLAGQVVAMLPRLRVRDQAGLRAQFPGLAAEDLADALIERAARASGAVGGAVGAWAALPVLPAFPAEVMTETLAVIGIEIKLVAELHEAYGLPAPGSGTDRMTAYLAAWAHRRGVFVIPGGLALAAGSPLARRLRWRLATRTSRSAFALGPLFTGAAAGVMLNRRETRRLGREIHTDLRRRAGELPGSGR